MTSGTQVLTVLSEEKLSKEKWVRIFYLFIYFYKFWNVLLKEKKKKSPSLHEKKKRFLQKNGGKMKEFLKIMELFSPVLRS